MPRHPSPRESNPSSERRRPDERHRRRGRGAQRLHEGGVQADPAALAAAARIAAAPGAGPALDDDGDRRRLDGRAGGRAGAHRVRHRPGPAGAARGRLDAGRLRRRRLPAHGRRRRVPHRVVHPAVGQDQPGGAARPAHPGVPAHAEALARVPRVVHVGPHHLAADERPRRDPRAARRGHQPARARRALHVVHGGRPRPARLDVGARAARARSCRSRVLTRWFQVRSQRLFRRSRVASARSSSCTSSSP